MVRHVLDRVTHLLDMDRRATLGRERFDVDWPVTLSIPFTPIEYDALRFLSSLYPANPGEIVRAAVVPYLDPNASIPSQMDDGLERERTARVQLGLCDAEAERLNRMAHGVGVEPETLARWTVLETLGPLVEIPRP